MHCQVVRGYHVDDLLVHGFLVLITNNVRYVGFVAKFRLGDRFVV